MASLDGGRGQQALGNSGGAILSREEMCVSESLHLRRAVSQQALGSGDFDAVVSSDDRALPIIRPMNTIQTVRGTVVPVVVTARLPSRRSIVGCE